MSEQLDRLEHWLTLLAWLSSHQDALADLKATCILLGHEPSGEQLMTHPPIDVCWWCGGQFRNTPHV